MLVTGLRIQNYKGFQDSGWLEFGPNFTLVVGQNNVGKTALLEAFRLSATEHRPYRGLSVPRGGVVDPASKFTARIVISGPEAKEALLARGGALWLDVSDDSQQNPQKFIDDLFSADILVSDIVVYPGGASVVERKPSHGYPGSYTAVFQVYALVVENRAINHQSLQPNSAADQYGQIIDIVRGSSVYAFKAERLGLGSCPVSDTDLLEPNARNLPAVLAKLQINPKRWDRFNQHVSTIFPSVKRVVVGIRGGEQAISLWTIDPDTERDDLLVRLEESGTGVGQVLSILYVAMSRQRNVIVIDEPNSFLHPGAAKKLMQILKTYSENQYIISTHSPEILSIIRPDQVHLVEWIAGASKVTPLDGKSLSDMNRVLNEVGVELTDVFGADRVIWVEGPTEEKCFPMIAERLESGLPYGIVFVPLRNTTDFEAKGKTAAAVWQIYERLTNGPALLPPTLAFSFDHENRSEKFIEDLRRSSGGRAHFLPRATYENFLLHPQAIEAVLVAEFDRLSMGTAPTSEAIAEWIEANGSNYLRAGIISGYLTSKQWLVQCHAPSLLENMFDQLTGARLRYDKLTHSINLTAWLLNYASDELAELSDYVGGLLVAPAAV